jgi:hypothetical protein
MESWKKNTQVYRNRLSQEVALYFRPTESSDWKYQDQVYKRIYEVKLETQWGVRQFWYCFPEYSFPSDDLCVAYLTSDVLPFEAIAGYLQGDVSKGLDLGAILPHVSSSVLVFGRVR